MNRKLLQQLLYVLLILPGLIGLGGLSFAPQMSHAAMVHSDVGCAQKCAPAVSALLDKIKDEEQEDLSDKKGYVYPIATPTFKFDEVKLLSLKVPLEPSYPRPPDILALYSIWRI